MALKLPEPRLIDPASVPALRWGLIGTGIAGRFVDSVHAHTPQRAVAVAARDPRKTAEFAAQHGIRRVHADPTALIEDPEVEVVYVSTPHPLHKDLALQAIAAGKPVLIEKPIAMTAAEAQEIATASERAGVLAMEAMWTRYLPQSDVIRQVLDEGTLGDVQLVRADFGFILPFRPELRHWNPGLGGGALLDAGVYPISFASFVLGRPETVAAAGTLASTGVDEKADLLLTLPSGAVALASTSLVTSMPVVASVMGTIGRLDVHSPFFAPGGVTVSLGGFRSDETATWLHPPVRGAEDGFAYQATALASYVAEGRVESPLHTHAETVSILATIDEARRQISAAGRRRTGRE